MLLTLKLLFLIAGIYLMIVGQTTLALICFAITIGLTFLLSIGLLFVGIVIALMISG